MRIRERERTSVEQKNSEREEGERVARGSRLWGFGYFVRIDVS